MTFQVHIKIGSRWARDNNDQVPGSRVEVWAAREKQPSVKIYDSNNSHPTGFPIIGDGVVKYGKVWLTPYTSYKNSSETHAPGFMWYDDLIISRGKIADPK